MKINVKSLLPGIIITSLCLISTLFFEYVIFATKMLAFKWLIIAVAVPLVLLLVVFFFTKNIKQRVRFVLGCLLALVMVVVEAFGVYYIGHAVDTLDEITTPNVEYAEIGIYVRDDDTAESLIDAKDYVFGVLEALDRDVKKPNENPSVGVILCATKDDAIVEYALSRSMSPTMVADYTLQLPDKKLLEQKVREIAMLADDGGID